ncbi:hypothetical protein D3C81_304910 [compost metagenome]
MAKPFIRYTDGTKIMANEESVAWNLAQGKKADPEALAKHMKQLDTTWRSKEGRKPIKDLTEREQMLEGRIPWDAVRLKELS